VKNLTVLCYLERLGARQHNEKHCHPERADRRSEGSQRGIIV